MSHDPPHSPGEPPSDKRASLLRRWMPLVILLILLLGVILSGAHRLISLETLVLNKARLEAFLAENRMIGSLAFVAVYVAVVALSLPGALFCTLAGGVLFGLWLGTTLTVIAATAGAVILYVIARSSLGETLREKGGASVARFREGLAENAASYLLFVRLVPVFPFALVNLAAAIAGAPFRTFVWTTLVGILPASFAFTLAATSIDHLLDEQAAAFRSCRAAGRMDCRIDIDLSALVSPQLLVALGAIGCAALLPVLAKRLMRREP